MAKKKIDGSERNRRLEVVPGDVPVFYANNANVEVSNWDVKIRLGTVRAATATVISVQDVAHVYMSHSHFRAFVKSMTDLLDRIDKKEVVGGLGKPILPSE